MSHTIIGRLFRNASVAMPIVYSASHDGYTNDEQDALTTMVPFIPPPERPLLTFTQHTFHVRLNAINRDNSDAYAHITGHFISTFEIDAVCTGGAFQIDEVRPMESWSLVTIPPVLDVRIYDRRFSGMRRRANVFRWRPESEVALAQYIRAGQDDFFWDEMAQRDGLFADLMQRELPSALSELYVQMLCFIAAAMYIRKYSPNFPIRGGSPRAPDYVRGNPAIPPPNFDRTVGISLCRISTIPFERNCTDEMIQRYLYAPCILSHQDDAYTEHTLATFPEYVEADPRPDRVAGGIELMLEAFPNRLRRWANSSWTAFS